MRLQRYTLEELNYVEETYERIEELKQKIRALGRRIERGWLNFSMRIKKRLLFEGTDFDAVCRGLAIVKRAGFDVTVKRTPTLWRAYVPASEYKEAAKLFEIS